MDKRAAGTKPIHSEAGKMAYLRVLVAIVAGRSRLIEMGYKRESKPTIILFFN